MRSRADLEVATASRTARVSERTIGDIERGRKAGYSDRVKRAIEDALGWRIGDWERVLNGGEPAPAADQSASIGPDEYDDAIAKINATGLSDRAKRALVAVIESYREETPPRDSGQEPAKRSTTA
jgi:hypothetical protein